MSDKGWDRHFNRAPDVLGRTVLVNGAPFTIIGVMPPGFRGLQVTMPDLWAPLSRMGDFAVNLRGAEDKAAVQIIGRLKPDVSMESARAQLAAWDANQSNADAERRSLGIELLPQRGTVPLSTEVLAMFTPLFIAFGLILLIGCANVANLLLARGVARQKEIGIRLSLGASRKRIVRQLMTESVLLALVAAAAGYLISRVTLVTAVSWMLRMMPTDLGDVNVSVPAADWRVALFLVIAAVGATALFALIPALQATRVEPVRTLRGELVKDARPGRARNVLIAVQVFASAMLLISGAIFLRSAVASAKFDPGFRTADTVLIEMLNEPKRAALLRGITAEATITAHAAVKPALLAPPPRAFADAGAGKIPVSYKFVSAPYFDVLGIPIVRGRAFTAAETDDHPVAIVTESTARSLFPNGDGVGETVRLDADLTVSSPFRLQVNPDTPIDTTPLAPRMVTIIGVARDAPGFRITDVKDAGVFLPISLEKPYTSVVARVQGDPDLARQTLLRTSHRHRSKPGVDHHDANSGEARDVLSAARVLGFADSRRARAAADGFGIVQRAVVPRRAAHEGNRRTNGARCDVAESRAADAGADDAAGDLRVTGRREPGRRAGGAGPFDRSRGDDRPDRAPGRSAGIHRKPHSNHYRVPDRRVGARRACRPRRPDEDVAAGMKLAPSAWFARARVGTRAALFA